MSNPSLPTLPNSEAQMPRLGAKRAVAPVAENGARAVGPLESASMREQSRPAPRESIRLASFAGWSIILLFFGLFGGWAVTAPLHGAVVANGVVKVEGNRKSVQHLEGGIVKRLFVKEGDRVAANDLLILLDDTQARTEFDVLARQVLVLHATEMRLTAELTDSDLPKTPPDLGAIARGLPTADVWNAQLRQFASRRTAVEGQRGVIRERIAQFEHQVLGTEAQVKALEDQRTSIIQELESLAPLVERGLISRPRYLQLERTGIALLGQIADARASIGRLQQAIAEQRQQLAQLDHDRMAEITRELRDTQARLLETIPRMLNAEAVLSRMEIRAPYAGRVVGLNVFAVGAVIGRGEKILDVVPEDDALIIEAHVAVEEISEVRPGSRADVHLTAYKQRIVPVVPGEVVQVSADRLTDARTGQPYYVALVRLSADALAELPNVNLYPGMPATVMIPTVERTAFDYLVGPLVLSFQHAFRQR